MSGKTVQLDANAFHISNEGVAKWKSLNPTIPVVSKTSGCGKQPGTMGDSIGAPNRIIVVEPDAHTRSHFKEILHSTNDFKLTGDFSSANEALNVVPHSPPDLMLLGFRRGDRSDIKRISLFKRLVAGLKIIMVLCAGDTDLLDSGLRYGADNCLIKPINAVQCLATLICAVHGPAEIVPEPRPMDPKPFGGPIQKGTSLTEREQEVMQCLAEGMLYKEIPDRLDLSYSAFRKCQQKIYRKLGVSNRSEAIGVWLHGGPSEEFHFHLPQQKQQKPSATSVPSICSLSRL